MRTLLIVLFALCITGNAYAAEQSGENTLVEDILHDVVDRVTQEADRSVRKNTGVSLSDMINENEKNENNGVSLSDMINENRGDDRRTGADKGDPPETVPGRGASPDDTRGELQQLAKERDREIRKIKEELDRELNQERVEFARENRRDENPQKLAEKRRRLEEKVQRAYDRFERKMAEENNRYQEKRERITARRR